MAKIERKDVLLACLSDLHSGGSTSLFPNHQWQGKNNNHKPTPEQRQMYRHFMKCAEYAKAERQGRRLIIIHDGDATEGVHHGSLQILTFNKKEQAEIHEELMSDFMNCAAFDRKAGDRLYYVTGTEAHTEDMEDDIGKDLSAEQTSAGTHAFEWLELEVNGRLVWLVHHGKRAGDGANEGNALRNWMRDVHFQCKKHGRRSPDLIITGHVHTPAYSVYVVTEGDGYHMMHGVICPSFQAKTRYAHQTAPVAVNEVGATFITITAEGDIRMPVVLKMQTKNAERVTA